MKKILILAAALLTGGFALPASAQHRGHSSHQTEVYISGYLACGSPIYSRRTVNRHNHASHHSHRDHHAQSQREREHHRRAEYLRQLEIRRAIERRRHYSSSHSNRGHGYRHRSR